MTFLGFEFRWGTDRKGQARLQQRTSRKKFRNSVKRVAEWCKKNRHRRVGAQFQRLNAKLRGYYNYYGVRGNYASLDEFFQQVQRLHLKWLNRRSQRELHVGRLSRADSVLRSRTTTHHWASTIWSDRVTLGLAAEASIHEEPGAGKLHAGICAGAVGQLAVLPRSFARGWGRSGLTPSTGSS